MRTLNEKQMKVVRTYASTLNMKQMAKRKNWTKDEAIQKVKEYVLSGSPLSINQFIESQCEQCKPH